MESDIWAAFLQEGLMEARITARQEIQMGSHTGEEEEEEPRQRKHPLQKVNLRLGFAFRIQKSRWAGNTKAARRREAEVGLLYARGDNLCVYVC